MQSHHFMPGSLAANELNPVARTIQDIRQESQKGFIGGGIYRGSRDFDAQFGSQGSFNFIAGSPWLKFHRQKQAIWLLAQKSRQCSG